MEHLGIVVGPALLKLSGYLGIGQLPAVLPRSDVRLHWLEIAARVDLTPSCYRSMRAALKAAGLAVSSTNEWSIRVSGPGFHFGAFPKEAAGFYYYRRLARLQLKGEAFDAGTAVGFVETFLAPWADPQSVRFGRLDVALDLEVPDAAVLAFGPSDLWRRPPCRSDGERWNSRWQDGTSRRSRRPPSTRRTERYDFYDALRLGDQSSLQLSIYDKLRHLRRCGDPGGLLCGGWPDRLRIEARLRPGTFAGAQMARLYDEQGARQALFHELPNPFADLRLVDLRAVLTDHPWLPAFILARLNTVAHFSASLPDGTRQAFAEALLQAAEAWPWSTPAHLFDDARHALQGQLEAVLGGLATS